MEIHRDGSSQTKQNKDRDKETSQSFLFCATQRDWQMSLHPACNADLALDSLSHLISSYFPSNYSILKEYMIG